MKDIGYVFVGIGLIALASELCKNKNNRKEVIILKDENQSKKEAAEEIERIEEASIETKKYRQQDNNNKQNDIIDILYIFCVLYIITKCKHRFWCLYLFCLAVC